MPEIEIRPIQPDDKQGLRDGFARLSADSRYRRFLSAQAQLSASELRYLTEVDHHDHEALVAIDPQSGDGVGVARYVRSPLEPRCAEVAVAVVDDWQGRGVGSRLTGALAARAREEGIECFTALVLAQNDSMLKLLDELGQAKRSRAQDGVVELSVELPSRGLGPLTGLLRAAATGQIRILGRAMRATRRVMS